MTEIVPIHKTEGGSYTFICPLPKGYRKAFASFDHRTMFDELCRIKEIINHDAIKEKGSFVDIMSTYSDRADKEKKALKRMMFLGQILVDKRGLFGAIAGAENSSGKVYLETLTIQNCDLVARPFEEMFETGHAFFCHNIDNYWQALLCRELVIRYFNLLNKMLK